jgi:transposase
MKNPKIYVGMDVHKSFSYATALTERGELVKHGKIKNFSKEFYDFFELLKRKAKLMIAIESTEMIMPFLKALDGYGELKVAHPTKLKLIAESKIKTDKIDSRVIADLLRTNYLPESYIPEESIRELRSLCRERYSIKTLSVRIKNQIRHCLLYNGIIKEENIFTKENRQKLRELNIDSINRKLDMLEYLEEKMMEVDEIIKEKICDIKEVELLTSIPGIGLYTAALLYSEIADIERFKNFSKLCSYAGLNPSLYCSGNKKWFGRITKQGNKLIRWALIQCSYVAIRFDPEMKAFYERLKISKGSKKAIVAVARKLLKRVYAVWKRKGPYESRGSV